MSDYFTEESAEVHRLWALLPKNREWFSTRWSLQITLLPRLASPANDLIMHKWVSPQSILIQIDFSQWQHFSIDQRNLLFWHEISRLQMPGISATCPENLTMKIGIVVLLLELLSQNLIGLATTFAVVCLAGYQFYQYRFGEQSFRLATTADQAALKLAEQFGYSQADAYNSLLSALTALARRIPYPGARKKYQVRLSVLEMLPSEATFSKFSSLAIASQA